MDDFDLPLGLMWYAAFLLSLTCHEAAHSVTGQIQGDDTAAQGGQSSLNPIPHIQREPFGTILWPWLSWILFGYMIGWASAPYDPYWRMRHPKRGAWVSLAGPGANFALALIAGVIMKVGLSTGIFHGALQLQMSQIIMGDGPLEGISVFLSILFTLNIILGVFNLIPVPPLDGFGALALVLPSSTAAQLEELRQNPMFRMIGLVVSWKIAGFFIQPALILAYQVVLN